MVETYDSAKQEVFNILLVIEWAMKGLKLFCLYFAIKDTLLMSGRFSDLPTIIEKRRAKV